jgi:hypothetical protein
MNLERERVSYSIAKLGVMKSYVLSRVMHMTCFIRCNMLIQCSVDNLVVIDVNP